MCRTFTVMIAIVVRNEAGIIEIAEMTTSKQVHHIGQITPRPDLLLLYQEKSPDGGWELFVSTHPQVVDR